MVGVPPPSLPPPDLFGALSRCEATVHAANLPGLLRYFNLTIVALARERHHFAEKRADRPGMFFHGAFPLGASRDESIAYFSTAPAARQTSQKPARKQGLKIQGEIYICKYGFWKTSETAKEKQITIESEAFNRTAKIPGNSRQIA